MLLFSRTQPSPLRVDTTQQQHGNATDARPASEKVIGQLLTCQNNKEAHSALRQLLTGLKPVSHRPGVYITPQFADGKSISIDISLASKGLITLSPVVNGFETHFEPVPMRSPIWANLNACAEHAHLLAEWKQWADAPASISECRQQAMEKMADCLLSGQTTLLLGHMGLTSIPAHLPPGLKTLDLSYNCLTTLPEMPNGLCDLLIKRNDISRLSALPQSLEMLNCSENNLNLLPELPKNLWLLDCSGNKLTKLPRLPNDMAYLHVNNNQLTQLPDLPQGTRKVYAQDNLLTKFPSVPAGIVTLDIRHNQITSAPVLSGDIADYQMEGNPFMNKGNLRADTPNPFIEEIDRNPDSPVLPAEAVSINAEAWYVQESQTPNIELSRSPDLKTNVVNSGEINDEILATAPKIDNEDYLSYFTEINQREINQKEIASAPGMDVNDIAVYFNKSDALSPIPPIPPLPLPEMEGTAHGEKTINDNKVMQYSGKTVFRNK